MFNITFNPEKGFNISPNSLTELNKDYLFCGNSIVYGDFSKINVFIGENNAGKSRFLRYLFSHSYREMSNEDFNNFFNGISRRVAKGEIVRKKSNMETFIDIYMKTGKQRSPYSNVNNDFFEFAEKSSKASNKANTYYFPVLRGFKDYKNIINSKLSKFLSSANSIQNKDSIHHYISLLNLEAKGLEDFDIYRDIVSQEYFKDHQASIKNILTGGKLYQEIKSMLLGDSEQRRLIEEYQNFLRDNFFNEYGSVQLIPNEEKKTLYVKIGDDERPIYDWGDGTQQLIIILFSLFVHKDEENKVFFIEEPEMYLHPGILRKFIEVINSEIFKNHQYFITTHSNVILDTSADVNVDMSIFKFKKIKNKTHNDGAEFIIEQCNNGDVSLLNELGIRNSSVFLSNCSIWVEGITDRLYLKHFLDLYINKHPEKSRFRENIDFTFIEYGGGNLAHFNFETNDSTENINAKYINNKIFLIADNDNSMPTSIKGKRKSRLKEILGENFYELQVLEIENLITQNALKTVLIEQNPAKVDLINQKFEREKKFKDKKLGKYIDELFNNELRKYSSDSGTIKNKLEFCNAVIKAITDFDSLSEEAKILTEKIYCFIEKNN